MKIKYIDTLFATACFSLLNMVVLALNFSLWGCLCAGVTILYYILRINVVAGKQTYTDANAHCITQWLGEYLGAFALDTILILACQKDMFVDELITSFRPKMFWAIVLLIAGYIVSRIFGKSFSESKIRFVLRYALMAAATVWSSLLVIKWNTVAIVTVAVSVAAIAMVVDLLSTGSSKTGYTWMCVILAVFGLASTLYPLFAIELVHMVFHYRAQTAAPLVAYMAVAALFAVCGVQTYLTRGTKKDAPQATRVYIFLTASTLMWMLTEMFSTTYDAVFILLTFAMHALFLFGQHRERDIVIAGASFPVITMQYVAFSAAMLLLPVMFFVGVLWEYVCIVAGILGVYAFYTVAENKQRFKDGAIPVYKTWLFWQLILTAALVCGIVVVTNQCRFAEGYVFLALCYAAATAALFILNIENKKLKKNHSAMRAAIVAAMSLLMIFAADQVHTTVNYEVDNLLSSQAGLAPEAVGETDQITVTVLNEDDTIVDCFAYWLDDEEQVFTLTTGKDAPNTLAYRDNGLCVICEYESGVTSTDVQWFYDQDHLAKKVIVGTPKYSVGAPAEEESLEDLVDGEMTSTAHAPTV